MTTMNEAVKTHSDVDDESNSRKRAVDESQLDDDEKQKLESRRAYNRQCAAKARKRSKELVSHLQTQVEELTKDKAELKRENDVMKAQLELLENQNKTLMMNQLVQQQQGGFSGFPSHNNFLPGTLLNASNSLVSSSTTTSSSSNTSNSMPKLQNSQQPSPSINPSDLSSLIARLTQQQQPPPQQQQQQAFLGMGGADNGQLAALLGLTSLIQAQNDSSKNLPKH